MALQRPIPVGGWSRLRVAQLVLLPLVAVFGVYVASGGVNSLFHQNYLSGAAFLLVGIGLYWGSFRFLRRYFPRP